MIRLPEDRVIITVAQTGAFLSLDNPNVPTTPDTIAQSASDCYNEGAAIVHVHARHKEGKPTISREVFQEIHAKIRAKCLNTGWHRYWGKNTKYFQFSPGLWKEGADWLVEKKVKCVGTDTQSGDIFLATKGPDITPWIYEKYKKVTGRNLLDDFPKQYDPPEHPSLEYAHNKLLMNGIGQIEHVGGDIDEVTGMRVTLAAFPIRYWMGDASIVRVVAIVEE